METFRYDLIQCQERTWHSWENFTETLTQDLQDFLKQNPDTPVEVIFDYTCEGTMWMVNGSIFYKAIHDFAKKYNIDCKNITYKGSNEKLQESYNNWHRLYSDTPDKINVESECFGLYLYRKNSNYYDKLIYTKEAPTHLRSKKYNCLNANMMPHRLMFMLAMQKNGLIDTENTYTSFHAYPELLNPGPHDPILKHKKWSDILTLDFTRQLPIQFDLSGDWEQIYDKIFESYSEVDGLDWNKVGDFRYLYEDCYFTVTTESSESHDLCDYHWDDKVNDYFRSFHKEMFLTEKITRPMLNLHPQIIYGASGTLEHLQSIGFKTFNDYWDEDYDHLNGERKLDAIMDILIDLGSRSQEDLHDMYWDMMPILKHNQAVLLDITI